MKEDKENTRPKEKKVEIRCEDGEKTEKCKEKKETMTKVETASRAVIASSSCLKIVIRRLPPNLTKEELEEQLQPLPEVDYMEFFSNDTSLFPHLFARAYISFKNQEDIVLFRDRFDGYVFIDNRGQEYPAIVEFAPFQKTAKKRSKKKDSKCGTIIEDPDYKRFLEYYNGDEEKLTSTPETLLEEIEARSKELEAKKTTPLLDFLKNKQRLREEKKEERKRRELERKRIRDEERRKWREEERRKRKEAEKMKRLEKPLENKDKEQNKEEPKIKLLKKPDRNEDGDSEKPKEKFKKPEKPHREDRPSGGPDHRRRQNLGSREDRERKGYEDGRKEFRERDLEREKEREHRQREKERIRRQDEERRRRREQQDGENTCRKREEELKKEKALERRRSENSADSPHSENKKEESGKRERVRNKDRPAIQLYQPGARSRNRTAGGAESSSADRKPEPDNKKAGDRGDD
ncbi:regulator of nonsense transcripts 3B isoform X1 [Cyprinodon tularosa]|uniref:regulator of nonsense transcripts 3B isoform X1 n=1 Tax=Cyprinodon tularosa TaxID=77115 RepID=UPI0018E20C3D|nr:regulator of nonsense transcripts 3B isoform X1 [Cyprinodon tularosa]